VIRDKIKMLKIITEIASSFMVCDLHLKHWFPIVLLLQVGIVNVLIVICSLQIFPVLCVLLLPVLGAFAKLQIVTISLVMSVLMEQLGSHRMDFDEF
jgi:hypothetical protein